MANKVKFGLSNVHIAPITYDGSQVTYGDIFTLPGAVNLSLDPEGESADFYADNTKYFSDYANQGYTGTLEVALINDDFREKILGQLKDRNGAFIENSGDSFKDFALGCQFEGDTKGTRYWFYQCSVSRPSVASQTIETSKTPVTDTLNITINARISDQNVMAKMEENGTNTTAYNGFFTEVYEATQ
jgi:phi13 family phage major tail protein